MRENRRKTEGLCFHLQRGDRWPKCVSLDSAHSQSHRGRSHGKELRLSVATQSLQMHTQTYEYEFTLCSAMHHFNIQNICSLWLWKTIPPLSSSHEPLMRCTDAIQVSSCHSNCSPCPSVLHLNRFERPDTSKQTQTHNAWLSQYIKVQHMLFHNRH